MRLRLLLAVALLPLVWIPAAWADIASARLEIQGAGLRLETVSVTTGIDIPTSIQTSFAGKTNDEAPSVLGLLAAGDLTGPGIDVPIRLTTTPGYRFHVPGLPGKGDYYLRNVRLTNGAGEVIQQATPSLAKITVADLLQTSLEVKQLTPEQIRARGIIVDARNYDVFEYTFTFLVNGEKVEVPFPVIVDPRTHVVTPVREEKDYGLPDPAKGVQPPRWTPPEVIPFEFPDAPAEVSEPGQAPRDRGVRPPRPRIPAALVIPNSLAVLHQFFAVVLNVTNGAPAGSTVRLEDVAATMKIKVPGALRTVKSTPAVGFGQAVPIVDPNTGLAVLLAQATGDAEWVLEGLKPGTHTVEVDIRATLREDGQDDVPLRATPSAAVIIHDPRFNITFSHPDTVRKGVEYSTFAFITNMSPQTQTIRVTDGLPQCSPDQTPNVCRVAGGPPPSDLTIPSGEMRVVEYRLRAGETGQIYATAGSVEGDVITAAVQLHMGVSATGIPLSPATLVLPFYAQFVDADLVAANLELLGLGYSLATAPVNQVTAQFPRVIKTDVFYRANDIARAGQRVFIAGANRDALSNLLLDLLGNSIELREWDDLRRRESAGRRAGAAVVAELRGALAASQASIGGAVDELAASTAHRGDFVVAIAHAPEGTVRPVQIALRGASGRTAAVANEAAGPWTRDLPFADVSRFDAFGRTGEVAVAGRWTEDLEVVITPAVSGVFELELLFPGVTQATTHRAHLQVQGTAGETLRVPLTRGANGVNVVLPNGGFIANAAATAVTPPPITILGARQDLHLDAEGHKVSLLFSRPIVVGEGVDLLTRFSGNIDFNRDNVAFSDSRPIFAAAMQHDERVVNLSFDHVLSTNASYTIAVSPMVDPLTSAAVSFSAPVTPRIDNDRPAGIVYGKFITGDNHPIPNAEIKFFTGHFLGCNGEGRSQIEQGVACNPFAEAPQYARTRGDGSFLFEYVPRDVISDPSLTGAYKAVGVTAEGKATAVEGSVRVPGRVHIVNLQLLGRGAAEGRVRYDDGEVVAGARVHVSSTMFNVGRDAIADANGAFRVDDLAVGPITFSAVDDAGNVAFASGEIATPGQVAVKDLVIYRKPFPGTGTVYGRVTRSDNGAAVMGARVGVYSQGYGFAEVQTDSDGRFEFTKVPSGFVTVLAAEWSVSRENAAADFDLRADETKEVNLSLSVTPSDMTFVRLTGKVLRENPLYPGDSSKYERVAGAVVNLAILATTADANGEFTFDGVPVVAAGTKTIRAYDPSTKRFGSVPVPNPLSSTLPNDVTVFIPANSYGGGTIRVRVVGPSGLPVDGFRVIEPGYPPVTLTRTGAGLYEYRDAPVGSELRIFAVDGPQAYGEQVASAPIRLDFAGQVATLVLRLPGQGTVRAKLRSDIDLIGDVQLTYPVWSEAEQSMESFTTTRSSSENGQAGFATFASVPALQHYTVSAAHPVYGYAEQSGQLAYEGDLALHTLQLNKLSTVRGVVYAIDGVTPISGAAVRLDDGHADRGIVYSQPDGAFVFHDVAANAGFSVTAEVTQSGIYRVGIAFGRTPELGGPAPETAVILRRRGSVEGRVVYAQYKVYDPVNAANRVPDDTPGDYSDNAPVPLASLWLRELDFPGRGFGSSSNPLTADVGGRFVVNNVFVGSLRAMAWAADNQELTGNWSGSLDEEGQVLTPVYIPVGDGGTGSLQVRVADPNQQYLAIPNAEVRLYRGGLFDLATTDDAGIARFDELPVGNYGVDAYSKALGKSGAGSGFTIARDETTDIRILLEFVGKVDGRLSDPMVSPSRAMPGVPVKLTADSFYAITSTDTAGSFFFEGIREGAFQLEAKDTESNRWAHAQGVISPENRRPYVELELERTDALHVAVYLPDDTGANSGALAGSFEMDVVQRCGIVCDYHRTLQGNSLVFPSLFINGRYGGTERYFVSLREIGGAARTLHAEGVFPKGSAADPLKIVYPAFGGAEVTVVQGGAPAQGARVDMWQGAERRSLYTDANGKVTATGLALGSVYAQATSVDGRFSGSATLTIARQSVPGTATIELGAFAGLSGKVIAEAGGPSAGTRVLASFSNRTLEILTGTDGDYLFQGIPTSTGGTSVSLVFVGPDGVTIGARRTVVLTNDWASRVRPVDPVTLDATAPQLVSITPADGSQNVSPDAPIRFVFSEALDPAGVNAANLQLVAADGSGSAPSTLSWTLLPDKTFIVTLTPTPQAGQRFPLRSNTLYRIVVQSAIRDLTGHTLPAPRGITFTTSDYAEPRVVRLVPSDKLPLPAQTTLQFHFNEPVSAQSLVIHFYKVSAPGPEGSVVAEKGGTAYVDPASSLYLAFAPNEEIEPQSYYRMVFSGIRDLQGNQLGEQTFHYFSFDRSSPYLRLLSPVPDGATLVSGVQYTLSIDARNDSVDGSPATDVAKVEYVRVDGATETYLTTVTAAPFAYRFAAPDAPEAGISYTVRAKATDLSGNTGPASSITWTVKPNAAPTNVAVTLSAASAYPGTTVTANVTFADEGVLAPVQVVLRATKTDGSEHVTSVGTEAKRDTVAQPWPTVSLPIALPVTLKPDTAATFTATVTDVRGLSGSGSASLSLLADTIKPTIISTAPAAETTYQLGATYRVSAVVADAQTGVSEVSFTADGATYPVPAASSTAGPSAGTRTFTSPLITVTARNVDTRIPVSIRVTDYNGNVSTHSFEVIYIGVNDPTAPKAFWLCPVDRAVIPAAQASHRIPLKVRAQDDVAVTSVRFRVTGVAGEITASRVGTSDDYSAEVTLATPAAGSDFTITAIVSDADAAHTIQVPILVDVVSFDRTIDATEAVDADTVQLYEGKSLLVRGGGKLVVNVPLAVPNLAVIEGGRLETLGTTTTRERKLELSVTDRLYVDCASAIDVSGKGYLGGWGVNPDGSGTRNNTALGMTSGNVTAGGPASAGGSYGGLGGANPHGAANAPYGSITDPFDLGSGGAGHPTDGSYSGGSGGGAVSLRVSNAPDAIGRVVLAGSVRADAGGSNRSGGSGGSVRVNARQLVVGPIAQITANGGAGRSGCDAEEQCAGGSGGRIAMSADVRLDLATPPAQVRAFGGATGSGGSLPAGAAGTVFVRRPGQTQGELYIAQTEAAANVMYTRSTPLANVAFDRIVLGPWALARMDGTFTVGGVADSIAAIEKDATAVVVARDAVPTLNGTTIPATGSTLLRYTPLEALLDLTSTAGIMRAEIEFSAAPKRVSTFAYPFTVDDHRVSWTVPADAPLGPATLKVKVIDRADRSVESVVAAFTVADNTAPVIDSFTALPASLYPGRSVTATIAAHDDVKVTRVSAAATIGTNPPSVQTRTTDTAVVTAQTFTFAIPVDTPGGTPMTVEASVEDGFPARVATKQLANVSILTDTVAPRATIASPADSQLFQEAAGSFAIAVQATDDEVAVKTVNARLGEGAAVPLTLNGSQWTGTLAIPPVDGEEIVSLPVTVTAADYAGNQATASIAIRISPTIDPNAPAVQWTCGKDARVPGGFPMKLRVQAIAANASNPVQKVEFFAGTGPAMPAASQGNNVWEATWNVPAGAATHTINAVATASGGAERSVKITVVAVVPDQIFSADAVIATGNLTYENKLVAVTGGVLTISGAHTFTELLVVGGSVTHPDGDSSFKLTTGTTYVACDAAIDLTGRGYPQRTSYPGATTQASARGGSHIGVGGSPDSLASTFGSVYQPQEMGGGGGNGPGGGAVTVDTGTIVVDGAIRANGAPAAGTGAGGSIWIRATKIGGSGTIEANGGLTGEPYGSGGGGAIAIEYTDPSSVVPVVRASGSNATRPGGAGAVYVRGPASTWGILTIDNGGRTGMPAELPSLGNGVAAATSSGVTLVTTRTDIPAYFARHWVEIAGKGTWRIAAIAGNTITLEPGANVAPGDRWQGVYRFDDVRFAGVNAFASLDPIRLPSGTRLMLTDSLSVTQALTADAVTVTGNVAATSLVTNDLLVAAGARLTRTTREVLAIEASNLTVAATASIDVTSLGYSERTTYPGAVPQISARGGSHMGVGGSSDTYATTFGSVYQPQELGGGGGNGPGGGAISIRATTMNVDGVIRANGETIVDGSGAAGSIWIRTSKITGSGIVEANGGGATYAPRGAGGGGAVALEYTDATSVPPALRATGGAATYIGGAGTVWRKGQASTWGDLIVDNGGATGMRTDLPSLGGGIAQPGTSGTTLVTDRATTIDTYFVGNFVELEGKGLFRITGVSGKTLTLEAGANAASGDDWRGAYRVDALKIRTSTLQSRDIIRYATLDKDASSTLVMNASAPSFPAALRSQIAVAGETITAPAGAVVDPDLPINLTATNTRTLQTFAATAAADGSFRISVGGSIGDTFTIMATDSHALPLASRSIPVTGTMTDTATLESVVLDRQVVAGGSTLVGTVRLTAPARVGGIVVALSSSDPAAASVPASITVPANSTAAQFAVATAAVAAHRNVTISGSVANTRSAVVTITPASATLAGLTLSPSTVQGGTSIDATVTLGAAAPPGGAVVTFASDSPLVVVPGTVTIAEGSTNAIVTVSTSRVAAATGATIFASYGATRSAALTLTACASMPAATPPTPIALGTTWVEDAAPANATVSGDAAFDNTQVASGTLALHFAASTTTRTWSFTGATAMNVASSDNLVLHALVNPCNPPRQIVAVWSDGTNEVRASWGENRITASTAIYAGAIPGGAIWTRLEIPAGSAINPTRFTLTVDGGEAWFDAIGVRACSLAKAPAPQFLTSEIVWFDDALPAGAAVPEAPYSWDSAQAASGNVSFVIPNGAGLHKRWFHNASESLPLAMDDVIVAYVLIDPCNPPREVMLEFYDGLWNRRAYWGENLIPYGAASTVERRRMGALPPSGKWVRLEVPVSSMKMAGTTLTGFSVVLHDGRAWVDRVGKATRVNLALNKPATQSTLNGNNPDWVAAKGVDGIVTNFTHTFTEPEAWWQVDLGAVQAIDGIDVWNGGEACCVNRMSKFWVLVSEEPFVSTSLAAARSQAGVTSYYQLPAGDRPTPIEIGRKGRYVRVQLAGADYLQVAETQVWAPLSASPSNLAGGRAATQSSTHADSTGAYIPELAVNGGSMLLSFSHTLNETGAWWQTDLGSVQWISTVDVDNTSDCCGSRMSNFYLFVSDTPFTSNAVAETLAQPGVSAYYRGPWSTAQTFVVDRNGRYVRLQLTGASWLHPFEVKVWSPFLTLPPLAKVPDIR